MGSSPSCRFDREQLVQSAPPGYHVHSTVQPHSHNSHTLPNTVRLPIGNASLAFSFYYSVINKNVMLIVSLEAYLIESYQKDPSRPVVNRHCS